MSRKQQFGFTLFELLLSIALLGVIVAFSVPVFQQLQTQRSADSEVDQIIALIRRAQTLAHAGYYDDDWGIHIQDATVTLFRGNDFVNRDGGFDEAIVLSNATVDAPIEIFFAKNTGLPSGVFTAILTTTTDYQLTITINEQGTLTF